MNFNILQILPVNAKIKLDKEIRKEIFKEKKVTEWGKILNIPLKNMSRYINGTRSLPIYLLNRVVLIKKINLKKLQNKIEIKIGRRGNYLKIGPIINITEKWVYVGELIKGDGHITQNFWNIIFVNKNEALIKHVEDFFFSLGIKENQISFVKREDVTFLILRSSVLAYIFNKILDIPCGKKGELNIPDFILSKKNLSISVLRGAFDSEGSVTFTGSRRISITSNSKNWLNQLKQILETLTIESRITEDKSKRKIPIYRLLIFHKSNLKKFLVVINPLHTKRKEKLKEILNNYKKNPQREFHKKILLSIKDGNTRKREISKKINQNLIITGNNINWLKKNEYITAYKKVTSNKGNFHKYKVTQKGDEYLKKSLSFFN